MINKIKPTGKEIKLDDIRFIISETNHRGVITYVNDYFLEVTGYTKQEVMNKNHNIVRHPDMPKAVFKFMWNRIENGENLRAVVKNMAKNGDEYWVITDFSIIEKEGKKYYKAKRKPIDKPVKKLFDKIYTEMKKVEDEKGVNEALKFLTGFIEKEGFSNYDDFIKHRTERKFLGLIRY